MSQDIRKLVRKLIPALAGFGATTVAILLDDFFIYLTLTDGEKIIIGFLAFLHFLREPEED